MKNRLLKTKLLTSLLALCMVVAVMPITAFAGVTDVTGGGTSTLYQHTYHTQIDTTAQVTIKDADGNVKETTSVNKSGDFIEGNLSAEAVQKEYIRKNQALTILYNIDTIIISQECFFFNSEIHNIRKIYNRFLG